MNERQANLITRFHRLVGLSAMVCAVAHLVAIVWTRDGIKPYSNLGWLPEQLLIGFAILVPGIVIVLSTRLIERRSLLLPLGASVGLAFISFAEFLRYFTPMTALFSIVPLIDAVLVSRLLSRRWRRRSFTALLTAGLAGVSTVLVVSYSGAGL